LANIVTVNVDRNSFVFGNLKNIQYQRPKVALQANVIGVRVDKNPLLKSPLSECVAINGYAKTVHADAIEDIGNLLFHPVMLFVAPIELALAS
jgi:hypothetical protein